MMIPEHKYHIRPLKKYLIFNDLVLYIQMFDYDTKTKEIIPNK